MNVKELMSGLGTNEWAAVAGSAAAFGGISWYAKRFFRKRKEAKQREELMSRMGIAPESMAQLMTVFGAVEKAKSEPAPAIPAELKLVVEAISECHQKQNENKEAIEGLKKDVEVLKKIATAIANKDGKGLDKELAKVGKDKEKVQKEEVTSDVDGLDHLINKELDKLSALTREGKEGEILARLNVIPATLPGNLPVESIANIREIVLFALMCRNRLLGTTVCIPRDKAADYLVGAHRNVMDLVKADGCFTPELEAASSRFFNALSDDSSFKMDQFMQKRA